MLNTAEIPQSQSSKQKADPICASQMAQLQRTIFHVLPVKYLFQHTKRRTETDKKQTIVKNEENKRNLQDYLKTLTVHRWKNIRKIELEYNKDNLSSFEDFWHKKKRILEPLSQFSINFAYIWGLSEEKQLNLIKELCLKIKSNLKDIRQLDISSWGYIILTDEKVKILGSKMLNHLHHLDQLNFQFADCKQITNNGVKSLTYRIGRNFANLKRLVLRFGKSSNITDHAIEDLRQNLWNLKKLEELELLFDGCERLTDLSLKTLSLYLGEERNKLLKLIIVFPKSSEITDKGIIAIGSQIQEHLRTLSRLELTFYESKLITNHSVLALIDDINIELKQLKLFFINCSELTDDVLFSLSTKFSGNLRKLNGLFLNFYNCEKITEDSVNTFVSRIGEHLQTLNDLTLCFPESANMTDKIVIKTAIQVARLSMLRNLCLHFGGCRNLTAGLLQALGSMMKDSFQNLTGFNLNFSGATISEQDIRIFISDIEKHLKVLQRLSLYVPKSILSWATRNQLKESLLSSIPSLLSVYLMEL